MLSGLLAAPPVPVWVQVAPSSTVLKTREGGSRERRSSRSRCRPSSSRHRRGARCRGRTGWRRRRSCRPADRSSPASRSHRRRRTGRSCRPRTRPTGRWSAAGPSPGRWLRRTRWWWSCDRPRWRRRPSTRRCRRAASSAGWCGGRRRGRAGSRGRGGRRPRGRRRCPTTTCPGRTFRRRATRSVRRRPTGRRRRRSRSRRRAHPHRCRGRRSCRRTERPRALRPPGCPGPSCAASTSWRPRRRSTRRPGRHRG